MRVIVCCHDTATAANTEGDITETEREVCERWARVWPVRGTERDINDQMQATVTHLVRLPYDTETAAIDHTHWLKTKHTSPVMRLNVERAYDPDMRRREMELQCQQRV